MSLDFFRDKDRTIVKGPIRPINIKMQIIILPMLLKLGVSPSDNPTVLMADATSKNIVSRSEFSVIDRSIIDAKDNINTTHIIASDLNIIFLGTLLSNISISSFPLNMDIMLKIGISTVVVFRPPPVDVGDAPIYINSMVSKLLANVSLDISRVLKPAVLGVTERNNAPSIFSDTELLPSVSILLNSNNENKIKPEINKVIVMQRTIFVVSENFLNLFLLKISKIVKKPKEPMVIKVIVVILIIKLPVYPVRLVKLPIKSNPALLNADIE